LTIKNEKSESSRTSEVFGHKNWGQIHLTLSFGPKSSLAPHSTPLYFFHTQFWVLSPVLAKLVVFIYVFNNFMDNFIVKQAKCNIIGIIMGGIQTGSNGKYSNMVCRSNFE
jgi:hypothetical protein